MDALLGSIDDSNPAGPDLSMSKEFIELFAMVEQTTPSIIGNTEEKKVNWKQVQSRALELCSKSRDLRVLTLWFRANIMVEGATGLASLDVLHNWLGELWESMHPQLDPEDGAFERASALAYLAGSETFLTPLRRCVLIDGGRLGQFSFRDLQMIEGTIAGLEDNEKTDKKMAVNKSVAAMGPEGVQALSSVLQRASQGVEQLLGELDRLGGQDACPPLGSFTSLLNEVQQLWQPYADKVTPSPREQEQTELSEPESPAAASAAPTPNSTSLPNRITSRQQVISALNLVCDYYRDFEPSSPVPLIIQRAEKLVEADFMSIIQEVSPEAIGTIQSLVGQPDKED
ncbi:type VI secretion system protein TssA [Paraferrimonas sedimenticola]|uniref:ImpA N-terminal domain-containing protein n=1 Tax=Paraferrimonas sedimenticola TaxID=375674 RepID=A0AA37RY36_9GAMM|nr:type VI secretion system protein TssA [Paraferrimonas sedimenticola]GLP96847.1 hypothetical protein GCM10007895_21530 [Paraferrimonas sedimenticola]